MASKRTGRGRKWSNLSERGFMKGKGLGKNFQGEKSTMAIKKKVENEGERQSPGLIR